jgi:exodeoxyribonuclease V alpha subunit
LPADNKLAAKAPPTPRIAPTSASPTQSQRERAVEIFGGATPTLSALPGEQVVYLPPFYYAEQGITRQLLRLAKCPPSKDKLADLLKTNFEAMFEYLATRDPQGSLILADRQKEGVVMAMVKPVGVLTGGPGTGKTTSMRALIRALTLKKKKVILAAPTGRAAKRLSEATGLEAKTLHRLLQLKPGGKSHYDQLDNPLPADVVIVDEVSMLDTLLMNSLLKGIATGTHLLLVGDADQLPSVGAGNVLSDIINSGVVPVVKLDHIFRQGAGSAIVTNAHRINQGQMPLVGKDITDFFFFGEEDPELAGDLVVDLVAKRIPARFHLPPEEIQVLAPMHRGKSGVGYLNEKLQEVLNPPREAKAEKQYGGKLFRVGDKVLQLRNNYDKEVFNGDGGIITAISHEDQTVEVRLEGEEGRQVEYDFGELDELTLAYAVSIHKSQGSEYQCCVIPVAMGHYMLLERKLIYTAVTRAKKLVVVVGSKKALALAVRNGPKVVAAPGENSETKNQFTTGGAGHRAGRYTGLAIRLHQYA